jgi:hypothetical protein
MTGVQEIPASGQQTGPAGPVAPWLGFGLFTAYAAAVLVTAAYVVRRRDA